MSLRPRLHTPASPAPPQPDTPAAHYADPLEEEGARVNNHKHARNESLPRLTARGVANGNGAGNGTAGGKEDEEPYDKLKKKNRFVPGQKVWIVIAAVLGVVLLVKLVACEYRFVQGRGVVECCDPPWCPVADRASASLDFARLAIARPAC